jgi:hypothetical protein
MRDERSEPVGMKGDLLKINGPSHPPTKRIARSTAYCPDPGRRNSKTSCNAIALRPFASHVD